MFEAPRFSVNEVLAINVNWILCSNVIHHSMPRSMHVNCEFVSEVGQSSSPKVLIGGLAFTPGLNTQSGDLLWSRAVRSNSLRTSPCRASPDARSIGRPAAPGTAERETPTGGPRGCEPQQNARNTVRKRELQSFPLS